VKPNPRPVYLNLLRIYLPLAGWVSVLHRVSGALLFLALPLAVWGLSVSLSGADGFRRMAGCFSFPLPRLFLLLVVWALAHHGFAGLRHLALDAHWGVAQRRAWQTSVAVLIATGLVTLFAAWRLFA
jgi:succinate dehydrogenase / fumarate reductase cytochrome b subunit